MIHIHLNFCSSYGHYFATYYTEHHETVPYDITIENVKINHGTTCGFIDNPTIYQGQHQSITTIVTANNIDCKITIEKRY